MLGAAAPELWHRKEASALPARICVWQVQCVISQLADDTRGRTRARAATCQLQRDVVETRRKTKERRDQRGIMWYAGDLGVIESARADEGFSVTVTAMVVVPVGTAAA